VEEEEGGEEAEAGRCWFCANYELHRRACLLALEIFSYNCKFNCT